MGELTGGFAWIMDSLESDYAGKIAGRTVPSAVAGTRNGLAIRCRAWLSTSVPQP